MGKDKAISKIKMPKKATATAQKTAAKVKKPVTKAVHRVYKKPRFFRPKTKSLTRTPKLMRSIRKTVGQYGNSDPHKLILYPVTSDKNVQRMENENTLTFIVAFTLIRLKLRRSSK